MKHTLDIRKIPGRGRGVFSQKTIRAGEIIEVCPVIVLSVNDRQLIDNTQLYNYYFSWGKQAEDAAIALGHGSLYNHAYQPNAKYIKVFDHSEIHFVALRDIEANEELTVNYNGDSASQKPVWFEAIEGS